MGPNVYGPYYSPYKYGQALYSAGAPLVSNIENGWALRASFGMSLWEICERIDENNIVCCVFRVLIYTIYRVYDINAFGPLSVLLKAGKKIRQDLCNTATQRP